MIALGRAPKTGMPPGVEFAVWDPERSVAPVSVLERSDAVVHLAGEPVAQRWSPEVKRRIRGSRVDGTLRLVEAMRQCSNRPTVLVSASAVGYYGDRGSEQLNEGSAPGKGFLTDVCVEWERAALSAESLGVRVATLRFGTVLSKDGGALGKMLPAFRWGLGGRLGSGEQYMAWIHIADLVSLIQWAIDDGKARGPINAVAPLPVTNADFTHELGRALGRPAILPVPRAVVRLLFGEMSEILFQSQRVIPDVARKAGFEFRHPEVFAALKDVLAS